ncbi:2OG-Fe(II) oxygenase [Nostocaceae cyanobacterium CENA357]|uniref:2OG-Fe(II) oxygenase n=1 Tax=Atlanticothrix silvestris CENA357 TaxID=1725252 RepID=A0A8J7H9T8_9CYAN|nr:2OG-Fe(II) oxygenase [Atlanticothrix silvestris]MBH8552833.1 2OG-Fe(II) oxygenase [Atlanticothrix silvestris CENA357]
MNILVKKFSNRIVESFYQIPFLRNKIETDYQASVEKHINNLPLLSTADQNLVETLRNEGIIITSLAALSIPSTPRMLQVTKKLMLKMPHSIPGNEHKFVTHATNEQIMEYPEIFYWGLQQRLLDIIENYLGLPVAYHHPSFRRDLANQVQRKTRLWHLDKEDRKMIKVIVYLHDIDDDGGPFQYIPLSFSSTITRSLRYNYGYVQAKTMQQVISPLNWKSCTGSSGTVIIADTAKIFHRGKIPTSSDRFAIFFDYTSQSPKHPFYCQRPLTNENLLILAEKLSEKQKQCVFWR